MVNSYTIPFIKIPFQQKITNVTRTSQNQIAEKGNKENSTFSSGVSEQLVPCEEKDRRLPPCNQSKNVETVCSFSPF